MSVQTRTLLRARWVFPLAGVMATPVLYAAYEGYRWAAVGPLHATDIPLLGWLLVVACTTIPFLGLAGLVQLHLRRLRRGIEMSWASKAGSAIATAAVMLTTIYIHIGVWSSPSTLGRMAFEFLPFMGCSFGALGYLIGWGGTHLSRRARRSA